jgi:hypothetical protein
LGWGTFAGLADRAECGVWGQAVRLCASIDHRGVPSTIEIVRRATGQSKDSRTPYSLRPFYSLVRRVMVEAEADNAEGAHADGE